MVSSTMRMRWPVPIPVHTSLERVRIECLNLGAEYVWADVLCLRQKPPPVWFHLRDPAHSLRAVEAEYAGMERALLELARAPPGFDRAELRRKVEDEACESGSTAKRFLWTLDDEHAIDVPMIGAVYRKSAKQPVRVTSA